MDKYKEECKACWCKTAKEMQHNYSVWFNCRTCPFPDCYEPDTKELYLSGVSAREAEYMLIEKLEKLREMEDEKYMQSDDFKKLSMFSDSVKQKVNNSVLLTPEEFEEALNFCHTRAADKIGFFSVSDLVSYQLSGMGYKGAAKLIVECIEEY